MLLDSLDDDGWRYMIDTYWYLLQELCIIAILREKRMEQRNSDLGQALQFFQILLETKVDQGRPSASTLVIFSPLRQELSARGTAELKLNAASLWRSLEQCCDPSFFERFCIAFQFCNCRVMHFECFDWIKCNGGKQAGATSWNMWFCATCWDMLRNVERGYPSVRSVTRRGAWKSSFSACGRTWWISLATTEHQLCEHSICWWRRENARNVQVTEAFLEDVGRLWSQAWIPSAVLCCPSRSLRL